MKVSVVIPAYRAAKTICRAVDSVLAQTVPAHEIIIVDDGSPDDQNEVIERTYCDRVILVRQANGKTAKARNTGIERATGDFIAFLDADDYWEPTKLEKQLAVFERHPEVGLVAGRFWEQEPNGPRHDALFHASVPFSFDKPLVVTGANAFRFATLVWTGTVLVRHSAMGDIRFVSGLEPAEDRDFWVRIVSRQPAYLMSERLATYVLEPGSISRSGIARDCTNMLRVVERNRTLLGWWATSEWRSHTYFRWASNELDPWTAVVCLIKSFCLWPLPYQRCPSRVPLGRLRRLVVLALVSIGARPLVNEPTPVPDTVPSAV